MIIKFYKSNKPYGNLNNFKMARMFIYGRWWNNVEAAYQSRKAVDAADIDKIANAKTPREARDLGQKIKIRSDWDEIKSNIMYECVMAKFLQHKELRIELLKTAPAELVEDSPVDSYWGCGLDGTGKNMLGKILMRVRQELSGE